MSTYVGEFVEILADVAEHAVGDVENGYGGNVGVSIVETDEMQAIRRVLSGLPDEEWQSLPHSVREWAFGGPIKGDDVEIEDDDPMLAPPTPIALVLDWQPTNRSDADYGDESADLTDRMWAEIGQDGRPHFGPWSCTILLHTDYNEPEEVACFPAESSEAAKAAVLAWAIRWERPR